MTIGPVITDGNYQGFLEQGRRGYLGMFESAEDRRESKTFGDLGIPLIKESDWDDIIDELEKAGATLPQLCKSLALPCLDQNGTNYCLTEDTEVLTEDGWTPFPDYNFRDPVGTVNPVDHALQFQVPTQRHIYEHDGPIVYSTNSQQDFAVTMDHRMYVRKWDESKRTLSDKYGFVRAADLGWYAGFLGAPSGHIGTHLVQVRIPGDQSTYSGDDFIMLLALITSDGYAGGSQSTLDRTSFAYFRDEGYPQVRELALRCGFGEQPSSRGVFTKYSTSFAEWVRENCYCGPPSALTKNVPAIMKHASQEQIRLFLHWFGDRSYNPDRSRVYMSTSKSLIDGLQILLLRIGSRGSIYGGHRTMPPSTLCDGRVATPRHPIWWLTQKDRTNTCIDRKKHIETEHYVGRVYCVTVPNGTVITRRNNSILCSGNCWVNAPTHCAEIVRLGETGRVFSYSPASVGSPIKGFRNIGGWGSQALTYMRENGINLAEDWPANKISRSYYTDDNQEKKKAHTVAEYFVLESWEERGSCILAGRPTADGYSWWSHEVCGVGIVKKSHDLIIRNSWGMDWGDQGFATLTGSRKQSTDSVAICALKPL